MVSIGGEAPAVRSQSRPPAQSCPLDSLDEEPSSTPGTTVKPHCVYYAWFLH